MGEQEHVVVEPATEADLDELSKMLGELFAQESDFRPDKEKQLRGLRLIFEQPSRGRVFVLRRDGVIVGMINLLTDRPENLAQEFFRRHGLHESSMIPMRLLITPEGEQPQS